MNTNSKSFSLELSKEEMKLSSDMILQTIIDHFDQRRKGFNLPLKITGSLLPIGKKYSMHELIDYLKKDIFSRMLDLSNIKFQSFVPSCNNYIAVIASLLAQGFNPHCSSKFLSEGPLAIEEQVIAWINEKIGFSEKACGLFVSGGSMANLTAMVLARRRKMLTHKHDLSDYVAYISSEAHESIFQACSIIGLSDNSIKIIHAIEDGAAWSSQLLEEIKKDISNGKLPFCVVCCGGSTNTGIIEPFISIAKICENYDMWLHVDAAYGGAYAMHANFKHIFQGLCLATSITLDAHKTMFQPFGNGILLIKDKNLLVAKNKSDYLHEIQKSEELEYGFLGIELTRPFRALSLWMTIQYHGEENFIEAIGRSASMVEHIYHSLLAIENISVLSYSPLGIITLCYQREGVSPENQDLITKDICDRINSTSVVFWSITKVNGRAAIRIHVNNPELTQRHVEEIAMLMRNIIVDYKFSEKVIEC